MLKTKHFSFVKAILVEVIAIVIIIVHLVHVIDYIIVY